MLFITVLDELIIKVVYILKPNNYSLKPNVYKT